MEKRRFMKENKGYSLIELIIVLAIIVVMTGVSMVTITIIIMQGQEKHLQSLKMPYRNCNRTQG